ncbi:hypothetical protein YPPY47_3177, partial [Yersinia pestis PY-47]
MMRHFKGRKGGIS